MTLWKHLKSTVSLLRAALDPSITAGTGMQRQPTWLGNSSGLFTVSSAYSLQISQAFPDTSRVWDLFWKMKGPLRLNILLWQIYNGYVPAAHFLFYRHVVSAPCCCIRDNTIEDTLHAF